MRKKEDRLKTAAFVLSAGVFLVYARRLCWQMSRENGGKKMAVSIGMKMA
ncbi:MAG: hypothetical protein ACLR78_16060 [Roseburia sp.]